MRIETKGQALVILLEGMERLWALKASMCIQVQDIKKLEWHDTTPKLPFALRAPGTGLPRVLYAGSFWRPAGWEFWYLHMRKPGYVVIETGGSPYKTLRVSTDEATAFMVQSWYTTHQQIRNIA